MSCIPVWVGNGVPEGRDRRVQDRQDAARYLHAAAQTTDASQRRLLRRRAAALILPARPQADQA